MSTGSADRAGVQKTSGGSRGRVLPPAAPPVGSLGADAVEKQNKMKRVWMSWAGAFLSGVIAVSAAVASPRAGAGSAGGTAVPSTLSYYGFYYAVAARGGFELFGANGESVPCGPSGQLARACFVSAISFSPMNLSDSASSSILLDVGTSPWSIRLLFGGRVSGDVLQVWQTWRAPAPVSSSRELYAVSHQNEQALVLNVWSRSQLGTLDFSRAPLAETCDMTSGGTCPGTLDAAEVQVQTTVGEVLAGYARNGGAFHVQSYFLEIGVGQTQTGDGYSYCTADQFICGNAKCTAVQGACTVTHGRIKGMTDAPTVPKDPTFQQWELENGMLLPSDIETSDAGG